MKRIKIKYCLLFILNIQFLSVAFSQQSWTTNPFEQKVFVENKGQYDNVYNSIFVANASVKGKLSEQKILFSTTIDGVEMYFNKTGVLFKQDISIPLTQREIENNEKLFYKAENREKTEEGEYKTPKYKTKPDYFEIEWIGTSNLCELVPEVQASFNYTFGSQNDNTIPANVFKKITYKNIYPNVDIEYTIPKDSSGIKYNIILHPGANSEMVKFRYKNVQNMNKNREGEIEVLTPIGKLIEHAPISFSSSSNKKIESAYVTENNTVSFSIPPMNTRDNSSDIIIDPWQQLSSNLGANYVFKSAYDINYDDFGNTYVMGSYNPYKLVRFNNVGAPTGFYNFPTDWGNLWLDGVAGGPNKNPNNRAYGDFVVDETNGDCYAVEGLNQSTSGARIIKIIFGSGTGAAASTITFPGNSNFEEMWRAHYNSCTKQIVVAGGGHKPNQAAIIDVNNFSPTSILNTYDILASGGAIHHDIALFALDNNGTCFMSTAKKGGGGNPPFDNVIVKGIVNATLTHDNSFPAPGISNKTYHGFNEIRSVNYVLQDPDPNKPPIFEQTNAMNGMAVSPAYLYTYNSDSLKVWNKVTGALVKGLAVRIDNNDGPSSFQNGNLEVNWGGIAVSPCNDVFIGRKNTILKYSPTYGLTIIATMPSNSNIYDIKLAGNNKLYVCGNGFVSVIDNISLTKPELTTTTTPAACNNSDGTASVELSCIPGVPTSLTYTWSTTPVQTTAIATGLVAETYTVTVTSSCANALTATVTVNSTSPGSCTSALVNFDFNPALTKSGITGTIEANKLITFTNTSSAIACSGGTYAWEIKEWGTSTIVHTSTQQNTSFTFTNAPVGKCYAVKFTRIINSCPVSRTKRICIGEVIPPCENCIGSFAPQAGFYILSAWVKEKNAAPTKLSYDRPKIKVFFPTNPATPDLPADLKYTCVPSGAIIDGWQRVETEIEVKSNYTYINLQLFSDQTSSSGDCYFDDIRIFPKDGSMTSYVYDPQNLRLVAELDERNYATLYEYDEEGKLVRVKKETEKGVMTIKENKNNTKKK